MSQMLTGSVCFTDLKEALKKAHSSGSKAGNGKVYIGNAKPMAQATPEPVVSSDIEDDDSDLPF